jgi:hypothetical protein
MTAHNQTVRNLFLDYFALKKKKSSHWLARNGFQAESANFPGTDIQNSTEYRDSIKTGHAIECTKHRTKISEELNR